MIDFISLEDYFPLFINGALIILLFTLLHNMVLDFNSDRNLKYINFIGPIVVIFLIFYIGLRPVSGKYFVDMRTYANHFYGYANGGDIKTEKDLVFHYFMKFCSSFMSVHSFFLVCAIIYLYPMYRVSKVFFKKYWFYSFLTLVASFSFWTYGVNGIRNGMATSLFLLGLSYQKKIGITYIIFLISFLFHKTLILPILAYTLSLLYNNPKVFFKFWLAAIPFSFVLGGFFTSIFTALGFGDDRLEAYLSNDGGTSFRFDFVIYSASAVYTAWYFVIKKKFKDKVYYHLVNTYLISNAFWILVIRANFSNRFAYLSWFMMGLVIIYPFIKAEITNKNVKIGKVMFLYFAFTYFMVYIYYAD